MRKLLFGGVFLMVQACVTEQKNETDLTGTAVNLQYERLEDKFFQAKSQKEVLALLNETHLLSEGYFPDSNEGNDVIAEQLFKNVSNAELQKFEKQLDSVFVDFPETVLQPLEMAFKRIKYFYPDFKAPKVVTMVTGFLGSDLMVTDSLVVIGLDYFGGPGALYRPQVYDYQLRRYAKENIVPAVLFFLSKKYNKSDAEDKTLLADMIWFGKGFEFVKQVAPDLPDSLIISFSGKDLTRTYNSQTDIWGFFMENRLLFEANEQKKQKYIGERPLTPEIGEEVPGGIGKWLGWRLVSRYLAKNPKVSLPELMGNPVAQQLLQGAAYRGQIDDE